MLNGVYLEYGHEVEHCGTASEAEDRVKEIFRTSSDISLVVASSDSGIVFLHKLETQH